MKQEKKTAMLTSREIDFVRGGPETKETATCRTASLVLSIANHESTSDTRIAMIKRRG